MTESAALINELKELKLNYFPSGGAIQRCTRMEIHDRNLTFFPAGICELVMLVRLEARKNQFSTLPQTISRLTALTHLYLEENQLTSLPNEISALTGLQELKLHSNPIDELPRGITALTNLNKLWIQSWGGAMHIKRAPKGITNIPCWNNGKESYPEMEQTFAGALRELHLYEDVAETKDEDEPVRHLSVRQRMARFFKGSSHKENK